MTVEVVTHVFGAFYATLLAQQLRSLARWRGDMALFNVCVTVVKERRERLDVRGIMDAYGDLTVAPYALDKPQLLNRTIGRNMAAKASTADWVWFADADYLFGPGSLEAVAALDPNAACMYWPRFVLRPPVDDWFDDWPEGVDPATRCTMHQKQRKAIGGCQIVPGHIARRWGYLGVDWGGHNVEPVLAKWEPPRNDKEDGVWSHWVGDQELSSTHMRDVWKHHVMANGDIFLDTKGDRAIRGWLQSKTGLPLLPADIPNVMRLRHRIPKTSQRHMMTEPQFRLYDGTETPENADAVIPGR